MTLMLPPHLHKAATNSHIVMRKFRVSIRCNECLAPRVEEVEMVDEIDGRSTPNDFYRSGAVYCIDPICPRCGGEGVTIMEAAYIRGPNDREPAAEIDA